MPKRLTSRERKDYLTKIALGISDKADKESIIYSKDSNKELMNLTESLDNIKESLDPKKESKKDSFTRVSVQISNINMEYLRKYKKKTGIEIAPKLSELLNNALDDMRKESE
jgi:hypothetical protein